ncbi:S8 family serine peptidase [Nakamurella sp. GG22]
MTVNRIRRCAAVVLAGVLIATGLLGTPLPSAQAAGTTGAVSTGAVPTGAVATGAVTTAPPVDDPGDPVPIPPGLTALAERGPVEVIMAVDPAVAVPTQMTAEKADVLDAAGPGVSTVRAYDQLPVELVRAESAEALRSLAATPGVLSLTAPRRYRLTADPDLTVIRQPEAQAAGFTGAGFSVAVIDSGVDERRTGVGAAFGDCSRGVGTGTCRIARYTDIAGSGLRDSDPNGHGTNVSAIVAKTAPAAKLYVYGVFDGDFATDEDVLKALDDIALNGPARKIRAVNLSLGDSSFNTSPCTTSGYAGVFGRLRSLGIIPVVSAGNSGYDAGNRARQGVSSPACTPGAVSVGATYPVSESAAISWGFDLCTDARPAADTVACFSQTGPTLSILAPGVEVKAAGITESGTSQAAPHVAGAVADVASADPALTPDGITDLLIGTGAAITDPRDGKVRRRLDIAAATGAAAAARQVTAAGAFVALPAHRTLDTRQSGGALAGGSTRSVRVAGVSGVPRTGVAAVLVNVTAVTPTTRGFLTAWAAGAPKPAVSQLSFAAGQNTAGTMVVKVGTGGVIQLFGGLPGRTHVLVDVAGYFRAGAPVLGGTFATVTPSRILDTRTSGGPVAGTGTRMVQVAGRGGIPAGASAVVATLTAVSPTSSGHLDAWGGGAQPKVSTLNFSSGQNRSNLVMLPIPAGQLKVFNATSRPVHLLLDVAGYYLAGTATAPGTFVALPTPVRLVDTRRTTGAVARGSTTAVTIAGRAGIPATAVSAVAGNVTAVLPASGGHLIVWPFGSSKAAVSNVNFVAGQTIANSFVSRLGSAGRLAVFNGSVGSTQFLVDAVGYYRGP